MSYLEYSRPSSSIIRSLDTVDESIRRKTVRSALRNIESVKLQNYGSNSVRIVDGQYAEDLVDWLGDVK